MPVAGAEPTASAAVCEEHDTGWIVRYREISIQPRATGRKLDRVFLYVRSWYGHQLLTSRRLHGRGIGFRHLASFPAGRALQRFDCACLVEVDERVELIRQMRAEVVAEPLRLR